MEMSSSFKKLKAFSAWVLIAFAISACGPIKKKESLDPDRNLTPEQKAEKVENQQKDQARSRKMLILNEAIELAAASETKLSFRALVRINDKPLLFNFETEFDRNLPEQGSITDKTLEIRSQFPKHNLEIVTFRFRVGKLDMMAIEYRLTLLTKDKIESASHFVLKKLQATKDDEGLMASQFEFPTATTLPEWAARFGFQQGGNP